ncbi:YtxH domain-containing protein [Gracilimonas mengyeensis]|uniref:Gas vesicle protein n=1 Tax=Gracilimonas mengyeensis TaxID=1302730 RepID=A0A521E1W9_9BACT|nr:YtxH domain-containing protein [Gracilimonas mengyeensis]SMO77946.1 Gas vesicle protein [Gracilimonas mengyeensis]
MKRGIGALIFGTLGFAGGLAAGFLLAPRSGRENRRWLEDRGRKIKADSEKRIDKVSQGIRESVKNSVPDLYEATEELHFSEEEEVEEITRHG